jgi:hypothetical protein
VAVAVSPRALVERFADVMNRAAWDELGHVLTEDVVEEYPQSGEVMRGLRNVRAVREQYPGGVPRDVIDPTTTLVSATEQQWVMTPMFTLVRVEGTGDVVTAVFRTSYPDGTEWCVTNLFEVRGSKIARNTALFAPVFEAPEWRAPYVESREVGRR